MSDGKQPQDVQKDQAPAPVTPPAPARPGTEVGGPKGLEPTRYGDWERDGRCVDF